MEGMVLLPPNGFQTSHRLSFFIPKHTTCFFSCSLVGAVAVVSGLYMVLWGKAKDLDPKRKSQPRDDSHKVTIVIEPKQSYKTDLTKPLMEEGAEEEVKK